jgi:cold shock CspA family protein
MVMFGHAGTDNRGRVAYVDPTKQWGYLHGARGERVYFHTAGVHGGVGALEVGDEVWYRTTEGIDPLSAVQVVRCTGRGR